MWESFEFDMICPSSLSLFWERWWVLLRCFSAAHKSEVVSESLWGSWGWGVEMLDLAEGRGRRRSQGFGGQFTMEPNSYASKLSPSAFIDEPYNLSLTGLAGNGYWQFNQGDFVDFVTGPRWPDEDVGRDCKWVELFVFQNGFLMSQKENIKWVKTKQKKHNSVLPPPPIVRFRKPWEPTAGCDSFIIKNHSSGRMSFRCQNSLRSSPCWDLSKEEVLAHTGG